MQALLVFKGEVFNGLKADSLTEDDLLYAQDHLRILSGFYGVLRPLDLMQPYRLEIGTNLKNKRGKNLYEFWGDKITKAIGEALDASGSRVLINLASNEYFKSIDTKKLDAEIITPAFKDSKDGTYKFITLYGKNARGMMTRFILKNRPEDAESLKLFDEDGYFYNEQLSKENKWVFTRG
ncbi:MAG: YaaA family protein, partial [Bacteroidales bacterium]